MWPKAEIISYHRYFSFKLNYPITGPRLLQYLSPNGYRPIGQKKFFLHKELLYRVGRG